MVYHESCRALSARAGSAISKARFVVIASDLKADHAGTAQIAVDGVSSTAAAADGDIFPMIVADGCVVEVEAGAAVTAAADVATDNAGRVIAWVNAAGNVCLGRALGAATAAGEYIPVQFVHKKTGAGS